MREGALARPPPTPCYSGFCRRPHRHQPAWRTSFQAPRLNGSERRVTPARPGGECGWRGSNPHGSRPPVPETGASTGSATSARGAAGRGAGGRLVGHAAGRGCARSRRAASRRALRRVSRTTTLAGRCGPCGFATTRTRCKCIPFSFRLCVRVRTHMRAQVLQSGRPGSNGPPPGWRPGALPTALRPREIRRDKRC